ncbi:MAG TPA: DUF1761 domain-containing protein [Ferruginibacter sp.]|nr:DUF1761 domain-containing protein [Ferruginibacter sp.]
MEFGHMALSALAAALSTMLVGFIWYHPKVFGTAWMKAEGLTEEQLKKGNMAKIFGLSFILAFVAGFMVVHPVVIHQFGALGMVGADPEHAKPSYAAFMADYGTAFRTFKHGALHGTFLGAGLIFPVIAINGLYSHKSWKLILVTAGYWVITLAVMGGIICGWSESGFHFS